MTNRNFPLAFIGLLFLSLFSTSLLSQTVNDAIRYSTMLPTGTARWVGVGSSMSALGGDFSALSSNPAGLAWYRRSEFMVSPGLYMVSSDSELRNGGESITESGVKFNLPNLGVVFVNRPMASKWKTINVGLGLNRLATFNQDFRYEGNTTGSIADAWMAEANDGFINSFGSDLAVETGAIFFDDVEEIYVNDFDFFPDAQIYREQTYQTRGSINELVLSFAGNYNERLMIGATVGLPFVNYEENRAYQELDTGDEVDFFNGLTYDEDLETTGIGVHLKAGFLLRLNQTIRLGGAVHTPTRFSLTDNYKTQLSYDYTDDQNDGAISAESPDGTFEYKIKSPWRYIGSAGFIIGRSGFISAEVEYLNYGKANFDLTSDSNDPGDAAFEEELNAEVAGELDNVLNFRIGGEYALEQLRFRAGYNIFGTPFAADNETNSAISLGLGWRKENFFLDLAYRIAQIDESFAPYSFPNGSTPQVVDNAVTNSQVVITAGFKF